MLLTTFRQTYTFLFSKEDSKIRTLSKQNTQKQKFKPDFNLYSLLHSLMKIYFDGDIYYYIVFLLRKIMFFYCKLLFSI